MQVAGSRPATGVSTLARPLLVFYHPPLLSPVGTSKLVPLPSLPLLSPAGTPTCWFLSNPPLLSRRSASLSHSYWHRPARDANGKPRAERCHWPWGVRFLNSAQAPFSPVAIFVLSFALNPGHDLVVALPFFSTSTSCCTGVLCSQHELQVVGLNLEPKGYQFTLPGRCGPNL